MRPGNAFLLDESALRCAAIERVVVMAWHGAATPELTQRLEEAMAPHHARFPDGAGLVVLPLGPPPDAAGRAALDGMSRRIGPRVVAAAVVLPITGVKGALVRTAASGVVAAMRLPFPTTILGSHRAAAEHVIACLRAQSLAAPALQQIEERLALVAAKRE